MNTQTENKAENKPIFPMEKKDFIYKNTDLHGGDVPQETQVKTELNELNYIQLIENELNNAFNKFNTNFFNNELNKPIITIQRQISNELGYFVGNIWENKEGIKSNEINLSAEKLQEKPYITLLHELIHLYHFQKSIKDTSRNGYYHNKVFKNKAKEMGFILPDKPNKKSGYSETGYKEELNDKIKSLSLNQEVFKNIRRKNIKKSKKMLKYNCNCSKFYSNQLIDGFCNLCNSPFIKEDAGEEE